MDKPLVEVLCDTYGYLCSEDPRSVVACTLNQACLEELKYMTALETGLWAIDLDEGRMHVDPKNVQAEAVWALLEAGVHLLEFVIIGHEDEDLMSELFYVVVGPNYPSVQAAAEFMPKHKGRHAQVLTQHLALLNTD